MPDTDATAKIVELLASIAASLAEIAHNTQRELPDEPNLQRPLEQFPGFDWGAIDATVVKVDEYGPAIVEWGGRLWTRRSPENKFGEAIWYSRAAGKDEAGNNRYLRLITFKRVADPEPISRTTEKALRAAAPTPPHSHTPPSPTTQPPTAAADPGWEDLPSASQRPRSAEAVRAFILRRAAKEPGPQNDDGRDRKRLWAALSNINSREEYIRAILTYFYGADVSTKTMTAGQCHAVAEWINSERQPDGSYVPDLNAVAEMRLILAAIGQPELLGAGL